MSNFFRPRGQIVIEAMAPDGTFLTLFYFLFTQNFNIYCVLFLGPWVTTYKYLKITE